ncbi:MAG: SIS domain-containing protein [Magnetococcales bacterium]|nr:SIS domain-containing protein [Magnetococcales bacterium]
MNAVEQIFQQASTPRAFAEGYFGYLNALLGRMDCAQIGAFIDTLLQARQRQSRIFFIGNGGSAATASHFANDIAIGSRSRTKPFRALSLCDNLALITAIGNDFGYDQVFVRQLENQMDAEDVVVAISASGNSPNVLHAVDYAKAHGGFTVGLTGFGGGKLRESVHLSLHVPSNPGEYGPVEDIHMILDHLVGAFLMLAVREEQNAA